ncbi:MarR family transcriptional regulator [Catelliglobosispora koreensis]|uniref:MarR family transcriptional regulator n=1 Tax=Catelliglobosispora koreensis TaxID=129052 RepID=UPI00036AB2A6|nr:MarR family transcriptional regulator [Catelliglobosispora koreensis]
MIRDSLRELGLQLALLNFQVSNRLKLNPGDLNCLDIIGRHGPLSPSTLTRLSGMHPATMTGVLDRLEKAGWINRERDPNDRRAVLVSAVKGRGAEVLKLYSGMNTSVAAISASYSEAELAVLADFLQRCKDAAEEAIDELPD